MIWIVASAVQPDLRGPDRAHDHPERLVAGGSGGIVEVLDVEVGDDGPEAPVGPDIGKVPVELFGRSVDRPWPARPDQSTVAPFPAASE